MSLKGQTPLLVEPHQNKLLGILCAQAPVDEEAVKAPTASVFESPQAEGGAQIPSTLIGHPGPLISMPDK